MKRVTMWLMAVVLSVTALACLSGCDLLDGLAPVPSLDSYSDGELAEELLGRGFSELEDLLGDIFDDESVLRPLPQASHSGRKPRPTGPGGRARSIR